MYATVCTLATYLQVSILCTLSIARMNSMTRTQLVLFGSPDSKERKVYKNIKNIVIAQD